VYKHAKSQRGVSFIGGEYLPASGKLSTTRPKLPRSRIRRPVDESSMSNLTRAALGGSKLIDFVSDVRPTVLALAGKGTRKPNEVSQALNQIGVRNAKGKKWDPDTVFWLLHFTFKIGRGGKSPKVLASASNKNTKSQPASPVALNKSAKSRRTTGPRIVKKAPYTPLTDDERKRRLDAISKSTTGPLVVRNLPLIR